MEYFVIANSFAAPFVSDESESYVEADSPEAALTQYAADYSHPAGLYVAQCYASADDYHKNKAPLAKWESNMLQEKNRATEGLSSYSYLGHGGGKFEVDGKVYEVEDPAAGSVVS